MERIAVFLPNWVGDVVMATPLLRSLRERFPTAELIGVVRSYAAEVLRGNRWLNEMLVYRRDRKDTGLSQWQLLRELRNRKPSTALLLTNSLHTAALAWLSGARERVGYYRDGRSWLLTNGLLPPRDAAGKWQPISAVDYYLNLGQLLRCDVANRTLELPLLPDEQALGERLWSRFQFSPARPVVAFHAAGGGAGTATAKAWPLELFAELARRLVDQHAAQVLVLCGPNERDAARAIVAQANSPDVHSLAEEPVSIAMTKGCLQRCQLLVSTDSGPRHIATALDVPTVGIFGATDPRWAQTYHPAGQVVFNKLDCGPCGEKHCPLGHHRCLRELSVESVYQAAKRSLLERRATAA